jgi:hypothetical protein
LLPQSCVSSLTSTRVSMMGRWFLILIAVPLCCGLGTNCGVGPPVHVLTGDGLNPDGFNWRPERRPTRIVHGRSTGRGSASSSRRFQQRGGVSRASKYTCKNGGPFTIEVETDAILARALVTCRGCLPADDKPPKRISQMR